MPRAGVSETDFNKMAKGLGASHRRIGKSNLRVLQLPPGQSEVVALARLTRHPQLKFVELDRKVPSALVTNDPYLGSQWHTSKIKASSAWDSASGAGLTVAVVDSGVLPTHPDLKLVPGWNFFDNNSNTADVTGHGTSVAGALAATMNNGSGVAGVAGDARIMPLRVSDLTGYAFFSNIASAVTYAADNGVRVVNVSFASTYSSASVQSAGAYLKNKGGLLIVGAGNSGTDDGSGSVTSMITVSATDENDNKASWSSFGKYVSLAAPGTNIWTTSKDGTYRSANGTSFSSPVAAGVVALIMSANPSLTSSQVESILYSTAVDLGTTGRDTYFGYGRVDAAAAVQAALSTPAADTQAPSVAIAAPLAGGTVSGAVAVDVNATDNIGVTRVALAVNGVEVAADSVAPYQFSWDSTLAANGTATLVATAYDAAGNKAASKAVSVSVSNATTSAAPADTVPPTVTILNPSAGALITTNTTVKVSASDNAGAATIKQRLLLDGREVAVAIGGSMSYTWNARKAKTGQHIFQAIATDASGNTTTTSVSVNR